MAVGAAIAGGLGLIGALYSAHEQSKAAKSAARTQAAAADRSADIQREIYYQNREDLAPWRQIGQNALAQLWQRVQAGPGQYRASPGYQFRLAEGEKAIQRSAAARGGLLSGATEKALLRYGQNYATADYDNFLRRYYQSLAPFQSLAHVGQTTGVQLGQMGQNYATNAGRAWMQGANALAQGIYGVANAKTQAVNSLFNLAGQGLGLYGAYKKWW